MGKRVDLKAILADPAKREKLMVQCIIAAQAREGICTTVEQATMAYRKARRINGNDSTGT